MTTCFSRTHPQCHIPPKNSSLVHDSQDYVQSSFKIKVSHIVE